MPFNAATIYQDEMRLSRMFTDKSRSKSQIIRIMRIRYNKIMSSRVCTLNKIDLFKYAFIIIIIKCRTNYIF